MIDEKDAPRIAIPDPNRVPVQFVNQLVGTGFLNGVVNVSFATAQFTPMSDGSVEVDAIMASRLRMDLNVAQQLHEQLGRLLKDQGHVAELTKQ